MRSRSGRRLCRRLGRCCRARIGRCRLLLLGPACLGEAAAAALGPPPTTAARWGHGARWPRLGPVGGPGTARVTATAPALHLRARGTGPGTLAALLRVLDHGKPELDLRLLLRAGVDAAARAALATFAAFQGLALLPSLPLRLCLQVRDAVWLGIRAALEALLAHLLVGEARLPARATCIAAVETKASLLLDPLHKLQELALKLLALLSATTQLRGVERVGQHADAAVPEAEGHFSHYTLKGLRHQLVYDGRVVVPDCAHAALGQVKEVAGRHDALAVALTVVLPGFQLAAL
mmetsp:Transcript_81906/g.244219  ORF Transcript_81906/g.244219 Transcript_81906/m.244219 type:complete len:292 (+) Transcript_81906:971-1846(+)